MPAIAVPFAVVKLTVTSWSYAADKLTVNVNDDSP